MKENYYDILEVNRNASPEVIEKAYKVLVKKYHPDLQEGELKQNYEDKLKLINEAYDVLSDEMKRKNYDYELEQAELLNQQKSNINYKNSQIYQNEINNDQTYRNRTNNSQHATSNYNEQINNNMNYDLEQAKRQAEEQIRYQQEYTKQINDAINKAYHDAYIQDLKNRGYRIKYKKSLKDYFRIFISIVIFIIIFIILWHIPFVKNYLVNLYNENVFIHFIVDIFLNAFNSITKSQ